MKLTSKAKTNILLLIGVVVLMFGTLMLNPSGEYGGSDDQSTDAITEIKPDYKPWFDPILEPKSGEIESLLFTLQGSIGVGIIAYIIGYNRGQKKYANN